MTKRRLTKAQAKDKRLQAQREEAAIRKLTKGRTCSTREVSVNALPDLTYDDPSNFKNMPSAKSAPKKSRLSVTEPATPEMAAREAAAQKEIENKRQRIAPAYNKGPYMFITDDTDPSELGRKL